MSNDNAPRYGVDPYLDWVAREGLPVHEDYGVDLFSVETKPWARYGVKGAAVHLKGRGDFANMFLFDIAPGQSTSPQRHLYEDVIYVLEGSGSTQIELQDGTKRSFEWGPKSLFAIPLNAKHRHFNGSGRERALLISTTNLPMILNVFHDEDFVFATDRDFMARVGKQGYFSGEGDLITVRPGNHMWETNFVPDLAGIELKSWGDRGAGGTNIMFVLADGIMHAHISEMPVGTYKKGHRHFDGVCVFAVTGQGYSLLWHEEDQDFTRIDWEHGCVYCPPDSMFHQHFNVADHPSRYLALQIGTVRYPLLKMKREIWDVGVDKDVKEGGAQVEYEDQDPRVHQIWLDEIARHGVSSRMGPFIDETRFARKA